MSIRLQIAFVKQFIVVIDLNEVHLSRHDLKSEVWFQTKIVQQKFQLALYYINFEMAKFSCLDTGFFSSELAVEMCYWFSSELVYGKLQTLFSLSCNLIDFFKQALWQVLVSDNFKCEFLEVQSGTSI